MLSTKELFRFKYTNKLKAEGQKKKKTMSPVNKR